MNDLILNNLEGNIIRIKRALSICDKYESVYDCDGSLILELDNGREFALISNIEKVQIDIVEWNNDMWDNYFIVDITNLFFGKKKIKLISWNYSCEDDIIFTLNFCYSIVIKIEYLEFNDELILYPPVTY